MVEQEGKQALMIQLPWTVPQQENTQAMILQQPNGQKVYLDLNHSTDTTAIWSFVIAMVIAFILGISATIIAVWYGRKSFKLTQQSFESLKLQISSSENATFEFNKMLILAQEELKVKELKILSRNNNLNIVRELIADNFYLAGSLQNQIEIAIEEIRQGKPDKFYHSRNFGEFKTILNSYQSSLNKLIVYLQNDSHHSENLKKHFRKIQLLSWNLYTADMNGKALGLGLSDWGE